MQPCGGVGGNAGGSIGGGGGGCGDGGAVVALPAVNDTFSSEY